LVACKWTYDKTRSSRRAVLSEIQCLVVRMAGENATWRYTRIKRALKNLHGSLKSIVPWGDAARRTSEYVEHYHRERNNQGLANELIDARCKSSRPI